MNMKNEHEKWKCVMCDVIVVALKKRKIDLPAVHASRDAPTGETNPGYFEFKKLQLH
jgi:hypothetical protein